MKPFLSDKNKATEKITLVSDDKIFSDDLEIAKKLNKYVNIWKQTFLALILFLPTA